MNEITVQEAYALLMAMFPGCMVRVNASAQPRPDGSILLAWGACVTAPAKIACKECENQLPEQEILSVGMAYSWAELLEKAEKARGVK